MAKSKSPKKGRIPPPYALAMVVSDAIWRDPGSGKRTILGCFSTIYAKQFPATHPIMAVYAALTDGRGKMKIRLQIVDVNEEREPAFSWEADAEFPDPRAVVELDLHIQNINFPEPGEYRIQLFAGSEFVLERRFLVIQIPEVADKEGDSHE